jgi:hypothetical protein
MLGPVPVARGLILEDEAVLTGRTAGALAYLIHKSSRLPLCEIRVHFPQMVQQSALDIVGLADVDPLGRVRYAVDARLRWRVSAHSRRRIRSRKSVVKWHCKPRGSGADRYASSRNNWDRTRQPPKSRCLLRPVGRTERLSPDDPRCGQICRASSMVELRGSYCQC